VNRLFFLFLIAFSANCYASQCEENFAVIVENKINEVGFIKLTREDKLEKFTHHDYSTKCEFRYSDRDLTIFTDNNKVRFLIREKNGNIYNYFGLFNLKRT
jgi:hypothetical protein